MHQCQASASSNGSINMPSHKSRFVLSRSCKIQAVSSGSIYIDPLNCKVWIVSQNRFDAICGASGVLCLWLLRKSVDVSSGQTWMTALLWLHAVCGSRAADRHTCSKQCAQTRKRHGRHKTAITTGAGPQELEIWPPKGQGTSLPPSPCTGGWHVSVKGRHIPGGVDFGPYLIPQRLAGGI